MTPGLSCGIVLHSEEDACHVVAGGQVVAVRYAALIPAPRRDHVLPGHLVAIAEGPAGAVVVWRWYDAVVLSRQADAVLVWEPGHGEVAAQLRQPERDYALGTRAYLSAGLPGAQWWAAGPAVDRAEDAEVELDEVGQLYTRHNMWASAFG